ncbi:DUF6746 family protein [Advenella sp. RU8]|uniref:DUF6746 family protein n=1 Tax=Advenella sp. RU8 TaxID=3399575 RepID=UPI003AB012B0
MKKLLKTAVLGFGLMLSTGALANERAPHFKGEPSETLAQAVANFSEYNQKLSGILEQDLTAENMAKIHQLTYTIENAIAKIKEEVDTMADNLEAVHIASETMDTNTAKTKGKAYLEAAGTLVK